MQIVGHDYFLQTVLSPARPKHNRHNVGLKHASGDITQNPKDFLFFQNPFKFSTLMRNKWKSPKAHWKFTSVDRLCQLYELQLQFYASFGSFFFVRVKILQKLLCEFGSMYSLKMPIGKSGSCLHTTLEQQMMCFSQSLRGTAAAITVHTCRAEPQCVDLKFILEKVKWGHHLSNFSPPAPTCTLFNTANPTPLPVIRLNPPTYPRSTTE